MFFRKRYFLRCITSSCADNGNRTHIICVEDREFTINLYPHMCEYMYKRFFFKKFLAHIVSTFARDKRLRITHASSKQPQRALSATSFAKQLFEGGRVREKAFPTKNVLENRKQYCRAKKRDILLHSICKGTKPVLLCMFCVWCVFLLKKPRLKNDIFNTGRKRVFACLF